MVAGAFHQYGELIPGNCAIEDLRSVTFQHDPFDGAIAITVWPRRSNLPRSASAPIRRADQISGEPLVSGEHLAAFDCRDTARSRQNHRRGGTETAATALPKDLDVSHVAVFRLPA